LSQEEFKNFEKYRKQEQKDGNRKCPNAQQILWSIFRKLGISVEFITSDFKDSVAALAYHLKADVLARDFNLANYYWDEGGDRRRRNCFNVYYQWKIGRDGGLQLQKSFPKKSWTETDTMRAIPTSPPETFTVASPLDKIHEGWTYIRGCGSNLTQLLNPHIKVRPLRQAVYSRLDSGSVLEILPHWDPEAPEGERATILEELVEPNDELVKLLDSPREAFDKFFGDAEKPEIVSELEWRNHVFSQKSVIADLCVWTREDLDYLDVLRSLL